MALAGARGGAHISAPRMKFKNRLSALEYIPMKGLLLKNKAVYTAALVACEGRGSNELQNGTKMKEKQTDYRRTDGTTDRRTDRQGGL